MACNGLSSTNAAKRRLHYAQQPQTTAQESSAIRKEPQQLPIQPPWRKGERLALWLNSLIYVHGYDNMGKRLWFARMRRFLSWIAQLVWQVPTYRWVKRSYRVDHDVYYARIEVCRTCLSLSRRAAPGLNGAYHVLWYCRSCRCGEKSRAELHQKLWYNNHECPEGKHADGWGQVLALEADNDENDVDGIDGDDVIVIDANADGKKSYADSVTDAGDGG